MADRRVARAVAGLGDVFTPSGLKIPTVCTPSTDFRADGYGRLRGYVRLCNPGGAFISVQKNGCTPDGPVPTSEEWAEIDRQRAAAGYETIGCLVTKKSSNFIDVAARQTAVVTAPLDRYLPGWQVAVDLILSPMIPILPLILGALNSAIDAAAAGALYLIPVPVVGGVLQQTLVHEVLEGGRMLAKAGVAVPGLLGQALAPVGLTIAKATATAKTTRGSVLRKIGAVSLEIAQGLALTASIAGGVIFVAGAIGVLPASIGFASAINAPASGGEFFTGVLGGEFATSLEAAASDFGALSLAIGVLKDAAVTTSTILAAKDAADAAKRGAKLARHAAEAQFRALVAEQRALDAEIARLEREIAAAPAPRTVAPMPAPARAAAPVQSMSNGARALLAAGLALALAEVLE